MTRNLKHPICFFVTDEMCEQLHQAAGDREVSLSQFLRGLAREFLASQGGQSKHEKTTSTNVSNVSDPSSGFQKPDEEKSQIGGKKHD